MKETAVIISTFNGEKYIEEQLDSILTQEYRDMDIFIYDDGSTDSTYEIIRRYEAENENVHIAESGKKYGYPKCFIELLRQVEGYRYYAFSDQDDVWYPTKLKNAVETLKRVKKDVPLLYYTAVDYCDSNLNHIRSSRFAGKDTEVRRISFQTLLFGGEAMGMTYVFNEKAREALLKANQKETFKDWFLKLYCSLYGGVIYNPVPSANYRRHDMAVTNSTNPAKGFSRVAAQAKEVLVNKDGFQIQKKNIHYIIDNCPLDTVRERDRELLYLFSEPNTVKKRIKKFFWKRRFRKKLPDEIGYRVAFLLGRI